MDNKWISVKERLPEGDAFDYYLVNVKQQSGSQFQTIARYNNAECYKEMKMDIMPYWELAEPTEEPFEITHWMLLPEPPK